MLGLGTAGRALRRAAAPVLPVVGTVTEAAWTTAHLLLYPFGRGGDRSGDSDQHLRLDDLSPVMRGRLVADVTASGTPILLVHGFIDNRSVFTVLRRALHRRGYRNVLTTNYSVLTHDIPTAAAELGEVIERLCARSGHDRIDVIGHSLGGLIARYYVQRLGGDAHVGHLVTLGTPHGGTQWTRLLPTRLPATILSQLRPDSALIAELAEPTNCSTTILAVYSDLDHVVTPGIAARCEHPDLDVVNVLARGVGHMSLPIDPRVARVVADHLSGRPAGPGSADPEDVAVS